MLSASKIVLGTVQFGLEYGINNHSGKPNQETVTSILDFAFKNNIGILDTAESYGDSQEIIGNYHKKSPHKFNIITKYSSARTDLSENLTTRIFQDLKTLNVESLYCYMFHSFRDFKLYFDRYKNEISELKKEKIINKFGVSVYTNAEIEELLKYNDIDLIQLPFNLLDNNTQRSVIIRQAKDRGIEIHTRSVFLQGLFFKNIKNLPNKLKILTPYLKEINRISKENDLNLNELSLSYVLQQEHIDNVLIGVDSLEQLKENIDAIKRKIATPVIRQMDLINVKEVTLLNPSNWIG